MDDRDNRYHELRDLLDCSSQTSLITERAQRKLNLPVLERKLTRSGIANNLSSIRKKCKVNIKSRLNWFTAIVTWYVLREITGYLLNISLGSLKLKIPSGVSLADSEFSVPGKIDLLIGAHLFWQVLLNIKFNLIYRHYKKLIFWQAPPSDTLETFKLNTVTYGQSSASYLAIKCLFVLAEQIQTSMPDVARVIREEFYVDDLLSGADSLEQVQKIVRELSVILETGCFDLRKYCSNHPKVSEG